MRKVHYMILASLVRREIEAYKGLSSGAPRVDTLSRIMRHFAERCGLDKQFLDACGIDEG